MSSGAGRWPSPPLYFVRKGLRPAFGVRRRLVERRRERCAFPFLPQAEPRRGRAGVGQSKGGGDGQRPAPGTFAQAPACLGGARQFAGNRDEDTRVADSFCVAPCGCPCVRMSSGAGRWPSPPLYFVRKGIRPAFGVCRRFLERRPRVLRFPHRTPSLVGAGRGLGKVKEEVTANGRRRGHLPRPLPVPAGPFSSRRIQTRKRSSMQTPGKKTRQREGSAGSGLRGGGTHAMSVASRQWLFASAVDSL